MRSENSLPVALVDNWQIGGFGIYVHWPYCEAKCPYCDFNSYVTRSIDHDAWRAAYVKDIKAQAQTIRDRVVTSVFFGGGTPSLMQPETISAVLETVSDHFTLANDVEISLEANPSSVETNLFRSFKNAGVNRVSLGIQALNDKDLKRLGRVHSQAEALTALDVAKSTFERVSFDLIYARQHQDLNDWSKELRQALSFDPDHLSLYQLTIEPGTAFGNRLAAGKLRGLPTNDEGADFYLATQELSEQAGLPSYEVSNHAKPGSESRHNLIYWRSGDYLGIGPGAHGRLTIGGKRYETTTDLSPSSWLNSVAVGKGATIRAISPEDSAIEMLLMGLRIAEPFDRERMTHYSSFSIENQTLSDLQDLGFVSFSDTQIEITSQGRPLLNAVLEKLCSEGLRATN